MMRLTFKRGSRSLTIAHARPYWLQSVDGLGADNDVRTEKPSGQDGELYKGSTANKRNIVIKATAIPPEDTTHAAIRESFFAFFAPRETGTLYIYDAGTERKIDYKVESCQFDMDGVFRDVTLSLICCDPTFKAIYNENAYMAEVLGLIEWPLELPELFEVGSRNSVLMAVLNNNSDVTRGMTITFAASGEVRNPSLTEVGRQEHMRILTTMHAGDVITVTTSPGNKRVKLLRGGEETNINNLWEFGGTWLQVEPGDNVYSFHADSGEMAMSVTLSSTPAYWGV